MKIYERVFDKLIDEFSSSEFEFIYGDKAYYDEDMRVEVDHENPELDKTILPLYHFKLTLNGIHTASSAGVDDPIYSEYQQFLDKERKKFYDDLNELIIEKGKDVNTLNQLIDMELRLAEVQKYYVFTNRSNITHSRTTIIKIPEDKYGHPVTEREMISKFFLMQLQTLEMMVNYLRVRIENCKTMVTESESNEKIKRSKSRKPIEKLDRYQSLLLFSYLMEAKVIKDLSANKMCPLIDMLTDHSSDNLKRYFNKIHDIKTGEKGNIPELLKDPNHNLGRVKDLIREVLDYVNRDLERNKKLHAKL